MIKMKKIIRLISSLLLLFLISGSIFAYGGNSQGKGFGRNQGGQAYMLYDDTQVNHQAQIDAYPNEELNQNEIDALIYMREEEKLARDVYLELYDVWGQQIFSNIANSEEKHTNAIKSLLDKYDLEDPMNNDVRGIFENQDLQSLYDSLVEKGSNSLVDALIVGATIEDLDIKDLENELLTIDNQDITVVFNNLMKGSRNHLRSFTKLLERNGGTYEPQYIILEEYNTIVNEEMETGTQYNSQGVGTQVGNNGKGNYGQQQMSNPQVETPTQARNVFSRMWGGFKGWFK